VPKKVATTRGLGRARTTRSSLRKLDESLGIISGLWTGRPFSYQGKHYHVQKTAFLRTPLQKPRVPIWVGGFWPRKAPFRRAANWDGVIPLKLPEELIEPEDFRSIVSYFRKLNVAKAKFDFVNIGWTTGKNREKKGQGEGSSFHRGGHDLVAQEPLHETRLARRDA
jgi:hypothetical protein